MTHTVQVVNNTTTSTGIPVIFAYQTHPSFTTGIVPFPEEKFLLGT